MINQPNIEIEEKGLIKGKLPESGLVIIFGASGDLAHRELIPALCALRAHKLVTEPWAVIGFDLKQFDDSSFRKEMEQAERTFGDYDEKAWSEFASHLYYVQGDFADDQAFKNLTGRINDVRNKENIPDNLLFHLATPQRFYQTIIEGLKHSGLSDEKEVEHEQETEAVVYPGMNDPSLKEISGYTIENPGGWRRVIIEKPFGDSQESAKLLDKEINSVFPEEQVYRVDHFLGKETVQNMIVFRFANPGFEPIWNRNYIESVQITAAEDIGIGTRGSFYEKTGVIKDMFQNHLLQLLCITAIEPPVNYDAESLRLETDKVLKSVCPLKKENFILGQYSAGEINGKKVKGYREEENVAKDSMVPTFAAVKLHIDNWRWAGVPFYLRTGKRMKNMFAEVKIKFKATPHLMFPVEYNQKKNRNILSFQLQPAEEINYTFFAKQPGGELSMRPVTMNFNYAESFAVKKSPSAYQWLIWDAMKGDQTLFPRSDWIYNAWNLVDPIIKLWDHEPWLGFPNYAAGTEGPAEATNFFP
jgi:glucose-6-phosphate 1-dehydrogenase